MIITENQLDEWVRGNKRDAEGGIVELVKHLVAASSPGPKERRFPLGDSIGQHGPDGVLDVDIPFDPFIPKGRSFWEIGTGLRASVKASNDYKNLVASIPESIRLESTFVFVTPLSGRREWEYAWKKDAQCAWIEEHCKRHEWSDVRVIDGTKLIDWVHHFPSVEIELAQKIIGVPNLQIETLEQRWNFICTIEKSPSLSPQIFLVNREEASAKVKEVFSGKTTQLKLCTHFPDQVVDFVSACLADLDDENRIDTNGRCLIVSSVNTWSAMVGLKDKHILVADFGLDLNSESGTILLQKALRVGHAVIFAGVAGGIPDPMSLMLPTPRSYQLKDALEKSGYSEEQSRILANKCNGDLGVLLRCLQKRSLMPEWAEGSAAAELVVAAILGSWTEKSDADRAIVERVSGKSYGEWIEKIREVTLRPGTPLTQMDGQWRFISRYEGWYALGARFFDDHLDRLREATITVLGEKDPQFELPSNERYAARIYGKGCINGKEVSGGPSYNTRISFSTDYNSRASNQPFIVQAHLAI